jgi:hypothetical protein
MPGFTVPGLLTISSNAGAYTPLFRTVAKATLASGRYTRLVVPACATMHLNHQASSVGWKPEQMQASDIAFLSTLMGYYAMDRPLEDLGIAIDGMEDEDLTDAPTVAYLQLVARYEKSATLYWSEITRDLRLRRESAIAEIRETFDLARKLLLGIDYRPQCMFDHLREVIDDEHTVILMGPPTIKAGFEKFYDDGGRVHWNQPPYRVFDMASEMAELSEILLGGRALCCIYERAEPGHATMDAVYGVAQSHRGPHDPTDVRTFNTYFTTNRIDELGELLGRRFVGRRNASPVNRSPFRLLPPAHELGAESRIGLVALESQQALYYRLLWNRKGSGTAYGVLIDGYLAGLVSYAQPSRARSKTAEPPDGLLLAEVVAGLPPHPAPIGKLLVEIAASEDCIRRCVEPAVSDGVDRLRVTLVPAQHGAETTTVEAPLTRAKIGAIFAPYRAAEALTAA